LPLSLLAASALTATPAAAQRIDNIVAFGDSYADDGNLFILGIDPRLRIVYPTGRFSGGTNYIDTLGQPLDAPIDNFAIGGALTDNSNTNGPPLGFVTEWNSFLYGGGGPAYPTVSGTFGENDLLAISIGGNDARFYQQTGGTLRGAGGCDRSPAFRHSRARRAGAAGAQNISFLAGDTAACRRSRRSGRCDDPFHLFGDIQWGDAVHAGRLRRRWRHGPLPRRQPHVLDNIIAAPTDYGIPTGWSARFSLTRPAS
jgi:hypothetical protein